MNRKEFPQGEIAEFRACFTLKAYSNIDSQMDMLKYIWPDIWEASSHVIAFPYLPRL